MHCIYCGKEISSFSKYCVYCGQSTNAAIKKHSVIRETRPCPSCGKGIGVDASVCLFCGVKINNDKQSNIEITREEENYSPASYSKYNKSSEFYYEVLRRMILALSGALGVVAFFLPFFYIKILSSSAGLSGWGVIKGLLNIVKIANSFGGKILSDYYISLVQQPESSKGLIGILILAYIVFGPILFFIKSIKFIIRAANNEAYVSGFRFAIIYSIFSLVIFFILGKDFPVNIDFFAFVGIGYWLSVGAMFGGFLSTFFET